MTDWQRNYARLDGIVLGVSIWLGCMVGFGAIYMLLHTPRVSANGNEYELRMREVKALEAIAAALCTTPGHSIGHMPSAQQCKFYQTRGVLPQ